MVVGTLKISLDRLKVEIKLEVSSCVLLLLGVSTKTHSVC